AVAWEAGQAMGTERATAEANEVLALVALATPAPAGRGATTVFTPREHDVLRLLVEGHSDREIAESLGLTYRTVTSYVRNILAKFDVTSRTAAATLAVRRGLV
ncbi:MAG: LuxR C-terminal-related transcriptional regulator, partial [Chloroflexota bacterium]|nr:LuxR C-terminal-related transcriptional regulator [Chloroflexota bacterium]